MVGRGRLVVECGGLSTRLVLVNRRSDPGIVAPGHHHLRRQICRKEQQHDSAEHGFRGTGCLRRGSRRGSSSEHFPGV